MGFFSRTLRSLKRGLVVGWNVGMTDKPARRRRRKTGRKAKRAANRTDRKTERRKPASDGLLRDLESALRNQGYKGTEAKRRAKIGAAKSSNFGEAFRASLV